MYLYNPSRLRSTRAVLFDLDGVIYVGDQPLPGVQALRDYLKATGHKLVAAQADWTTPA